MTTTTTKYEVEMFGTEGQAQLIGIYIAHRFHPKEDAEKGTIRLSFPNTSFEDYQELCRVIAEMFPDMPIKLIDKTNNKVLIAKE
jgi:hypothetical protein